MYKLTKKNQHGVKGNDGKSRNYVLYFLNGVLILKQKRSFDPAFEKGYDSKMRITNEYLLNNNIHQTRTHSNHAYFNPEPVKIRKVKYPISKRRLGIFNIPKDTKIEIS